MTVETISSSVYTARLQVATQPGTAFRHCCQTCYQLRYVEIEKKQIGDVCSLLCPQSDKLSQAFGLRNLC